MTADNRKRVFTWAEIGEAIAHNWGLMDESLPHVIQHVNGYRTKQQLAIQAHIAVTLVRIANVLDIIAEPAIARKEKRELAAELAAMRISARCRDYIRALLTALEPPRSDGARPVLLALLDELHPYTFEEETKRFFVHLCDKPVGQWTPGEISRIRHVGKVKTEQFLAARQPCADWTISNYKEKMRTLEERTTRL